VRNLIRKILKESEENEFDWVGDIEPRSDISPGAVYLRFGIHEGTKDYMAKEITKEFQDLKYENGRIIYEADSLCELAECFDTGDSNGYINEYIAKKILCDDDGDWWEPYHSSDLVGRGQWKGTIWNDLVVPNEKLVKAVLNYIQKKYVSKTGYNPNQLDIYGDLPEKQNVIEVNGKILDEEYFTHLKTHLDELGDLIDDEEDFEDLKHELLWAYGDAYNTAARDQIYEATMKPIKEVFGEGVWDSKQVQKVSGSVTHHYIKFDVTNIFWEIVGNHFEACWEECKRWSGENIKNIENLDEVEEYCDNCHAIADYSYFINLYIFWLDESSDGKFSPRFQEWPDDDDVEKYFIESVYDRI
jgi:hypothetical protein